MDVENESYAGPAQLRLAFRETYMFIIRGRAGVIILCLQLEQRWQHTKEKTKYVKRSIASIVYCPARSAFGISYMPGGYGNSVQAISSCSRRWHRIRPLYSPIQDCEVHGIFKTRHWCRLQPNHERGLSMRLLS